MATALSNDNAPEKNELQLLESARGLVRRAMPKLKRPADGVSDYLSPVRVD